MKILYAVQAALLLSSVQGQTEHLAFHPESVSRREAVEICEYEGGSLASPGDADLLNQFALENNFQGDLLVDGKQLSSWEDWQWLGGMGAVTFDNAVWAGDEPQSWGDLDSPNSRCLLLHFDAAEAPKLRVVKCREHAGPFVCQYSRNYVFHPEHQTWLGAKRECRALGGRLAELHEDVYAVHMATTIGTPILTPTWMGAKDKGYGMEWVDTDEAIDIPPEDFLGPVIPGTEEDPKCLAVIASTDDVQTINDLSVQTRSCREPLPFICEGQHLFN